MKWFKHENTDLELLIGLVKDDESAFTQIYQRFWSVLYAVAERYLKDDEMAKDAIQHVFMQLWENRKDLALDTNLKNFLFTMTKNHLINVIRHNNMAIQKNYEWAQMRETNEEMVDKMRKEGQFAFIMQCVEKLPEQKRRICEYKFIENKSNQEIAELMGISVQTVKNQYTTALRMLREQFTMPQYKHILLQG